MTFAVRASAAAARLQAHFAGLDQVLTIRRTSPGLVNPSTGAAVTTLAVNGLTAAGASSINLDATAVQGTLGQGWQFTIAGDATTYEVQADVVASSNALASVSISPVLAAEAADDAAVSITRTYGSWTYPAVRRGFMDSLVDGEVIQQDDFQLIVPLGGAAMTTIEPGDVLTWDGRRVTLIREMAIEPGDDPAVWRLQVRG